MSKQNIYDVAFAERIKLITKERFNDNLSEFARAVGTSSASLGRWIRGEADPSRTNLIKIAQAANVDLQWLALGKEPEQSITQHKTEDDGFELITDCRNVYLSAGFGAENGDYIKTEYTKVERDWLIRQGLKPDDCALFKVSGDSMYPTLKDQEDILVDCSKKNPKEGKIYVINNNGTMWVKTVQTTLDGIELLSDNPTYRPIKISWGEMENIIVIGQVKRVYRDV